MKYENEFVNVQEKEVNLRAEHILNRILQLIITAKTTDWDFEKDKDYYCILLSYDDRNNLLLLGNGNNYPIFDFRYPENIMGIKVIFIDDAQMQPRLFKEIVTDNLHDFLKERR